MDGNQNTGNQPTQENGCYAVTTGKYVATISHSITILGILMVVSGFILGASMYIGLGIFIVIVNLCSGDLHIEFTEDSLVTKLMPFQKPLIIPYRKIKAINIRDKAVELTLSYSTGDKKKKLPIHKFSKDVREQIKAIFSELEEQLYIN